MKRFAVLLLLAASAFSITLVSTTSPAPCGSSPSSVAVIAAKNTVVANGDVIKTLTVKKVALHRRKFHRRHAKKIVKKVVVVKKSIKINKKGLKHRACGHKKARKVVRKYTKIVRKYGKGRKVFRKYRSFSPKYHKAYKGLKVYKYRKAYNGRKGRKVVIRKRFVSKRGRVVKSLTIKKGLKANCKGIRANKLVIARKSYPGKYGRVSRTVIAKKAFVGKRHGKKLVLSKTVIKRNGHKSYRKTFVGGALRKN